MKLSTSIVLDAPVHIVAQALNAAEDAPKWQRHLVRMEVVEGGANQIGSLARLHYVERGRSYVLEDKLLECDPDRRWRSHVSGNGMQIDVETTLIPVGSQTELRLTWNAHPEKRLARVVFWAMRPAIRRNLNADLQRLARLVEDRARNRG